MTTKPSWLRRQIDREVAGLGCLGVRCNDTIESCDNCTRVADAIEAVALEFAERALREIYEVDDHDRYDERARGAYRVKREYAERKGHEYGTVMEWRHYRQDFESMLSKAIAIAAADEIVE